MHNAQIADVFDELADLLEFAGENPFRVRADRRGAHALRELDESVLAIAEAPDRRLADIPGIGQTLAEKTRQLIQTGSLPQLDQLQQRFPASVLAMVRIPIVINSDAHSTAGLDVMRYGVLQARRAGLTAADVLNTRHPIHLLTQPIDP